MSRWFGRTRAASSLGFRLGATLVLALLPLGVLSMVQTRDAQRQVLDTTLDGIGGATLQAVQPQLEMIRAAQGIAATLAAVLGVEVPPDAACTQRMQAVARGFPVATLVAYIPLSGRMTCASTGQPHDFSNNPQFARMIAQPQPVVLFNPDGPVSGMAVIGLGHPVMDASGRQTGIVAISLPHQAVVPRDYGQDQDLWQPALIATVTAAGVPLTASTGAEAIPALLPPGQGLSDLARHAGQPPLVYDGPDGRRRIVSVATVAEDVVLVGIWQQPPGPFWDNALLGPFLLPALTWAAALLVATIASERLVVRHVRALARAMTAFMDHRRRDPVPAMAEAPAEIARLHAAYQALIQTLEQDEAELQNLLVDKDRLLREVNHRSGNSLQIIASVMRMYRRETQDPALRGVLDGFINRVIALSSTHSSLYALSGRHDVPIDEVLYGVIRRLKEIHGVTLGTARKHFDPIPMPAQAAVPLALALAEIASCHFAAGVQAVGQLEFALVEDGDDIRLTVAGPVVPQFLPETTTGIAAIPRRMLAQFAAQLNGRLTTRIEDDRLTVDLTFPRSPA